MPPAPLIRQRYLHGTMGRAMHKMDRCKGQHLWIPDLQNRKIHYCPSPALAERMALAASFHLSSLAGMDQCFMSGCPLPLTPVSRCGF